MTYEPNSEQAVPTTSATQWADGQGDGAVAAEDSTATGQATDAESTASTATAAPVLGSAHLGGVAVTDSPSRRMVRPSLAIAMALVAGLIGGAVDHALLNDTGTGAALAQLASTSTSRPAGSVAALAAKLTPSVVNLDVTGDQGSATGSGFIIRSDGYILTNHHVVAGVGNPTSIDVVFANGSKAKGTVVGSNSAYDLAVVKVEQTGLPAVTFGNSNGVVVGDPVIAIGSPLGLQGTVTSGIVSALNRPVTAGDSGGGAALSYFNAIQTDAAINPGNSGGPLIDQRGAVIGVNSAIASLGSGFGGQSGSIGLGFAIPGNQAKRIAEEIIKTGKSQVPVMGVSIDTQFTGQGARIADVKAGQGAARAGLKAGDIIIAVDGASVADPTQLIVDIRSHRPGDVIRLTLKSGRSVRVTLGADTTTN